MNLTGKLQILAFAYSNYSTYVPKCQIIIIQKKVAKIRRNLKIPADFGAGGVTRTHDLLITKCSGSAQGAIFGPLGRFPLDMIFRLALFAPLSPPHLFG